MRARNILRTGTYSGTPTDRLALTHDERHVRRKLLTTTGGIDILLDLPQAIALGHGDAVELENGDLVEVIAEAEDLIEITARSRQHLQELCWHLGNRHLPTQIDEERLLIQRDHVIRNMLEGLGATMKDIRAPFSPVRGAYHSHGQSHDHQHDHSHSHGHHHGHDHSHG
jgi:urease accessory protein